MNLAEHDNVATGLRPPSLRIVDSHAHLCDPLKFSYVWAKRDPHDLKAVDAASFFAAAAPSNVEKMVFVEAAVEPAQYSQELAFAEDQNVTDQRIAAYIAAAPLQSHSIDAALANLARSPIVRGIRLLSRYAPRPDFLLKERTRELIETLASLNLICEIGVWARELPIVTQLVASCPQTTFVLNHAGKPNIAANEFEPWARDLARLAKHPNILCKLSGLATLAGDRGAIPEVLAPFIRHVVDVFSPERVVYGSDWPMASSSVQYQQRVSVICDSLRDLSRSELNAIFGGNAERTYRIGST